MIFWYFLVAILVYPYIIWFTNIFTGTELYKTINKGCLLMHRSVQHLTQICSFTCCCWICRLSLWNEHRGPLLARIASIDKVLHLKSFRNHVSFVLCLTVLNTKQEYFFQDSYVTYVFLKCPWSPLILSMSFLFHSSLHCLDWCSFILLIP